MAGQRKRTVCERCGTENRVGALICVGCHQMLTVNGKIGTGRLDRENAPKTTANLHVSQDMDKIFAPYEQRQMFGTGTLQGSELRIHIHGHDEDLVYELRRGELMIGRSDPTHNITPEIDLAPFEAYRYGVSRCHALLRRDGVRLTVQDLGSSNGTHLNGEKLPSQSPRIVRDGDTLRVGTMVLQVYFAQPT